MKHYKYHTVVFITNESENEGLTSLVLGKPLVCLNLIKETSDNSLQIILTGSNNIDKHKTTATTLRTKGCQNAPYKSLPKVLISLSSSTWRSRVLWFLATMYCNVNYEFCIILCKNNLHNVITWPILDLGPNILEKPDCIQYHCFYATQLQLSTIQLVEVVVWTSEPKILKSPEEPLP